MTLNKGTFFALLYTLIFFNPIGLRNEVWPYFIFIFFIYKHSLTPFELFLSLIIPINGVIGHFSGISERYIIDALALECFLLGYVIIRGMTVKELDDASKFFRYALYLIFLIMVLQKIFPLLQDISGMFFSGRGQNAAFLVARNGAVTGIAPEPAYAALHVITIYCFLMITRNATIRDFILTLCLVLLTRSVYGVCYLFLALGFLNHKLFFKCMIGLVLVLILNSKLIVSALPRIYEAILMIATTRDLLMVESHYGSVRFTNIVNSLNIADSNYYTGFSIPVIALQQFGLFFVFFIIITFLVCILNRRSIKNYITGLALLMFTGPSLLFLPVALLVKDKK